MQYIGYFNLIKSMCSVRQHRTYCAISYKLYMTYNKICYTNVKIQDHKINTTIFLKHANAGSPLPPESNTNPPLYNLCGMLTFARPHLNRQYVIF